MSLTVKFYDVEHGSCTHIITPNNNHLLFDIGSKTEKSICNYLKYKYFGAYYMKPDFLVITHPHLDHISDLENMSYFNMKPKYLWLDKRAFPLQILNSDSQSQINLKNYANRLNEEYSADINWVDHPENSDSNGGVFFSRFTPYLKQSEYDDLNNFSCVTIVEYCGFKVIITGDNPAAKLLEMLKINDFKIAVSNATVLLAPHHGRDSEFCSEFVSTVNPLLTVFSDKPIVHETQAHSAQKYGNATRGVNWENQNRKVFTTRNDGTITFQFIDQNNWSISTSTNEY